MTLASNPISQPTAYDVVFFVGVRTPGVAKVTNAPRKYKWDVKAVAGAQGQTETYQGYEVTDGIAVEVRMWTPEQVDYLYSQVLPLLQIDAAKAPVGAVAVYHPALQAQGILTVNITEIGQITPVGDSSWSVTIKMMEYRPPKAKNVTTTPSGSATKSTSPAKAKANPDPLQALVDKRDGLAAVAALPVRPASSPLFPVTPAAA